MKKTLVFLCIVFLSSTCASAVAFARTAYQTNLNSAIEPAYTGTGSLIEYEADYWWIPNISKDEIVLLNIVQDRTICYDSWLKYSNLTQLQHGYCSGTHNHDFVADKADNYLLKIEASHGGFNYTINCNHPIWKEPMQIVRGELLEGEEYNYWIPNVTKDEIILIVVFQDETICYDSWLKYSNLTQLQHGYCSGTHNHDFVADKADNYLLKIEASHGGFNYTIKHSERPFKPRATATFFNINPNPAAVGETITLKGILADIDLSQPLAGKTVQLYARALAGSWQYITSLATGECGIFTWQATIPEIPAGVYLFAAYYPGSDIYESTYNFNVLMIQ